MINYKIIGDDSEDIIDVVLNNRNLTQEQAQEIIDPSIALYNPILMKNMNKAIKKLDKAIKDNKNIGILIDPDADGSFSSAIIHDFLTKEISYNKVKPIFHEEVKSHGIDDKVFNYLKEVDIEFLIVPDAGSTLQDYKRLKVLYEEFNIESLILDHHNVEYNEGLEGVTLVNPLQKGCLYQNKNLSGTGVVYKFIQAFSNGSIDIGNKYIDLVACSLISDMMDMRDSLENRLLFNQGSMKENITSDLLQDFIYAKGITGDKLSIENIAFTISSNINSLIRVGSQEDKEYLFKSFYNRDLVSSNKRGGFGSLEMVQDEVIRRLQNCKSKQDKIVKLAVEKIKSNINSDNLIEDKVVILEIGDIIDSSLTGLLANKIMYDIVNRPVLLYRDKGKGVVGGSARGLSVESFKDICMSSGLFNSLSGHGNAFGFEIDKDKLEQVKNYFNKELRDINFETTLEIDAVYNIEIAFDDIKRIAEISDLWCNQIKEPLFLVKNVEIDTSKIMKLGNATYVFKVRNMSFTKNFGSKVFIEEFTHQRMLDKKARYPFKAKDIIADLIVKFRKNQKGYVYLEVIEAKSKSV